MQKITNSKPFSEYWKVLQIIGNVVAQTEKGFAYLQDVRMCLALFDDIVCK